MRKRLGKVSWWIPVINAIIVGLVLWIASGLDWLDVWPDEAWIAVFVLVYGLIVLRLPVGDDHADTVSPMADKADEAEVATVITALHRPPAGQWPFLGHRYPAGARKDAASR